MWRLGSIHRSTRSVPVKSAAIKGSSPSTTRSAFPSTRPISKRRRTPGIDDRYDRPQGYCHHGMVVNAYDHAMAADKCTDEIMLRINDDNRERAMIPDPVVALGALVTPSSFSAKFQLTRLGNKIVSARGRFDLGQVTADTDNEDDAKKAIDTADDKGNTDATIHDLRRRPTPCPVSTVSRSRLLTIVTPTRGDHDHRF